MSTPRLILPRDNPVDDWHYHYRAKVLKVYDGDTADLLVELGFNSSIEIALRFRDINTSELKRGTFAERIRGQEQRNYVARVITRAQPAGVDWPVAIVTHKINPEDHKWDRTFTRWVGDIVLDEHGTTITDKIVARWPETYDPY